MAVRVEEYPQLKLLAWSLAPGLELADAEALALYEAGWRHLDQASLDAHERALIERLVRDVGKGLLLV